MKSFKRTALAAVAAGLLSVSTASAADSVKVTLGWLPGGDRAHFYVAKQEGFYAAENLDVQIFPGKGSTDAMTKVATGVSDFGETGFDALLGAAVSSDVQLVGVMAIMNKPPDGLITTSTSGIKTLADLAGKKIATSPFTSSNQSWPALLRKAGVNPDSVTLLKVDPATMAPLLASGQVDGVIQFVTNSPLTAGVLQQAGKTIVAIPWADYGMVGYSNTLVASKKTLETRRDMVVRFVRATQKGLAVMETDPARAAAAFKASVPEGNAEVAEKVIKATLPVIFNDKSKKDGLGVLTEQGVRETWDRVAGELNVPKDKIDPMKYVDFTIAK